MSYLTRLSINPEIRSGKPCIIGTRITVYDILEYFASGMSESQILNDFQELTAEDLRACFAFAADIDKKLTKISA